ncbi:hypothetical protein BTR14_14685 [Rhizobium rhizosphaerae]|uniref:Peptidase M10 serralysin C-terminal domain-containing protein n=1 Tax=Xaviernesmea rhizosphaerae TaxID=1672749 RepID=A0ABX3PBW5_9HYPH|nr:M10 family metallopeptidase C-terminal domain-containing protein [Xaviernesmea rhizosphaerae]OQP85710.1 hypothetical protein BTR14_14685 [Xaviernesmea rhizosphaerae]
MAQGYIVGLTDTHPFLEETPVGTVLATLTPIKPGDGTPIPGGTSGLGLTYEIRYQARVLAYYSGMGESTSEIQNGFSISGDQLVTKKVFDYETDGHSREGWLYYEVEIVARDAAGNETSSSYFNFDLRDVVETIKGTDKSETVAGDAGADRLFGFGGHDKLFGKQGDDILSGGLGSDMLSGGRGSDTFLYKSRLESTTTAPDRITDFQVRVDHIDLSLIDSNSRKAGSQDFTWIGSKSFTGHAGELRAITRDGDTFIYADVNGDRKADMTIRLDDPLKLHGYDFIL